MKLLDVNTHKQKPYKQTAQTCLSSTKCAPSKCLFINSLTLFVAAAKFSADWDVVKLVSTGVCGLFLLLLFRDERWFVSSVV